MKKRTVMLLFLLTFLLLAGAGTGTLLLVYHEPDYYGRCAIPPGSERVLLSNQFVGVFGSDLVGKIIGGDVGKLQWSVFEEPQLNAYLQEGFLKWPDAASWKRHGISDPRVAFDKDHIRLGFRYGTKPWQTIISFDVRVWLVPKEVNMIAVEIVGRHAGSLPISAQSLLEVIAEQARNNNVEVKWYRHNGNPVALVQFQSDKSRPTFQLRHLILESKLLRIGGMPLEPGQQAALGPQREP
jgi:hypothetical protein